jgi:phosphoribosylamine--glycine ligase
MGTKFENGKLLTNGGRVLFITSLADTLQEARQKVLTEISKIECGNLFYRKDIGWQAI